MSRRRVTTILGLTGAVAACATALGAPARTGTVKLGGPAYAWDGGPITGALITSDISDSVPCGSPGKDCDDTLLNLDAGPATVSISSDDPGSPDLDLYVYRSNAQGDAGEPVKSSAGASATESVTFPASAGQYLVRVIPATAVQGTYHGEAKEVVDATKAKPLPGEVDYGTDPADPNASNGTGTKTRANDVAPTTTAHAPKFSQSKVLRGTARDADGKVAYVDVALVRVLSHTCRGLTPTGTWRKLKKCTAPTFLRARGTTSWHYTLRHRLPRGNYVLFAKATDNLGRAEGGFGKRNRVRFRIT